MNNIEREVCQVDISEHDTESFISAIELIPTQSLVLRLTADRRIDIGALCYIKRNTKSRKIPNPVDVNTLSISRCIALKLWCKEIISEFFSGESPYSLYEKSITLRSFINWCDQNQSDACLEKDYCYKKSLNEYTEHLICSMKEEILNNFTASQRQRSALKNSEIFFPTSSLNFFNDLPLLSPTKKGSGPKQSTATPDEKEIGEYLAACQYLFDGLTDFIIQATPYPHRIPFMETSVSILPTLGQLFTPYNIANKKSAQRISSWNFIEMRLMSLSEVMACRPQGKNTATAQLRKAKTILDLANKDNYHPRRITLARHAQNAFYCLFMANTGMNESPIRQLRWNDDYEVGKSDKAGFVVIKCRAGNLEQYFEIQKPFLKHFQKYLKLRSYLQSVEAVDYLFPSYTYTEIENRPTRANAANDLGKFIIASLDPSIKSLTPRQLRKYKAVYLLSENHSIATVSALIQNSPLSTIGSYSEAAEKKAIDEISTTIRFVTDVLDQKSEVDIPSGRCSGSSPADALPPPENYEPDCKNFIGCIFCESFSVHVDEISIRKLLSMRHVTSERIFSCTDVDQFNRLHSPTLNRIDEIIAELLGERPEMQGVIDRIRREIEEECELSEYWSLIYDRLIKLKIIL